jgi:hypothetical protein
MELWKLALIVVVACLGGIALYVSLTSAGPAVANKECYTDNECVLSLCDCKCYPKGQTPEEQEVVFCGINCLAEKGVSGCTCSEGVCGTK